MSCTRHVLARVQYIIVQLRIYFLPPESSVLSSTSFPHIIPVLSLLERGVALGETLEPWESAEVGVDVVMYHLEAARTIAHHGGIYRTNAETKLQGKGGKHCTRCRRVLHLTMSMLAVITAFDNDCLRVTRCGHSHKRGLLLTVLIPNSSSLVLSVKPLLSY